MQSSDINRTIIIQPAAISDQRDLQQLVRRPSRHDDDVLHGVSGGAIDQLRLGVATKRKSLATIVRGFFRLQ